MKLPDCPPPRVLRILLLQEYLGGRIQAAHNLHNDVVLSLLWGRRSTGRTVAFHMPTHADTGQTAADSAGSVVS